MNRQRRYQQTIEMAYRPDSGEVIRASELIDMDPQSFHDLRRQAKDTVRAIRRGEHREGGNRWFYHNGKAECPWYEGARLSQDRLRAVQFAGEKEGPEHRRLKQLIADSLERDPECAGRVDIEKVQRGRILVDERRRPDIHCTWRDRSIVFELQVSYTFLDVVLDRDRFYKSEGKWIIWVFNQPNEERAIYLDEKYYNKRHLFVLDAQAEAACIERGTLVLHCYYQRPVADRATLSVVDRHEEALVSLAELTFEPGGFRPYYFDYDAAKDQAIRELSHLRAQVEHEQIIAALDAELGFTVTAQESPRELFEEELDRARRWLPKADSTAGDEFLEALVDYAARYGEGRGDLSALQAAARQMPTPELVHAAQHALGPRGMSALLRVLSIVVGVPLVGQRSDLYSLIAAAIQESAGTQKPYALLFIEACRAYRAGFKPTQDRKLRDRHMKIVADHATHAADYVPPASFSLLVAHLFDKLRKFADGQRQHPAAAKRRTAVVWHDPEDLKWAHPPPKMSSVNAAISRAIAIDSTILWLKVASVGRACRVQGWVVHEGLGNLLSRIAVDEQMALAFWVDCGLVVADDR